MFFFKQKHVMIEHVLWWRKLEGHDMMFQTFLINSPIFRFASFFFHEDWTSTFLCLPFMEDGGLKGGPLQSTPKVWWKYMGVSLNGGKHPKIPKMIIFSRKTHGFVGETHHILATGFFCNPLATHEIPSHLGILQFCILEMMRCLRSCPEHWDCNSPKNIHT